MSIKINLLHLIDFQIENKMKKQLNFLLSLSLTFPLLYLTGCATLDRSECEVANWEIIGFEDGASGKPASTVGQHRSACAEYTIAPDLNLYLKGHNRGIKEYCTYQNGLELGQRGRNMTDVCSEANYKDFNAGYQKGRQNYLLLSEIQNVKSNIHSIHSERNRIVDEIKQNEELIIASETTSSHRRSLLEANKNLSFQMELTGKDLFEQESRLFELEERYARLAK